MLGPVGIADRRHVDVAPGVVEANVGFRIVAVQRADDAALELAEDVYHLAGVVVSSLCRCRDRSARSASGVLK